MNKNLMKSIERRGYKYVARNGRYSKDKAQALGCEIEAMLEEGVSITPEAMVERATPSSSSIHSLFEWEEKKAAHLYRVEQAGSYIRHLCLVTQKGEESFLIRAHLSVRGEREGEREPEYRPVLEVTQTPSMRSQILMEALQEIRTWRVKYERLGLTELKALYDAIDHYKG